MMLAALVLVVAISSQAQTRDVAPAPAPAPAGTGIIRGRVVAADNGVPIRRALVTISGTDSLGRFTGTIIVGDDEQRVIDLKVAAAGGGL
jgi:hypothetical protein